MRSFRDIFLVYFWPSRALDLWVSESNWGTDVRKREFRESHAERVREIRRKHVGALVTVAIVCGVGFYVANVLNAHVAMSLYEIRVLRLTSIVIVAASVLGRLGPDIETMDGNSPPEKMNSNAFRLFYLTGLFLAVIALFIEPSE